MNNEVSGRGSTPPAGRSGGGELYPFVIGGLIHDALNHLWPLVYKIEEEKRSEAAATDGSRFTEAVEAMGLLPSLGHIDRTLRLMQGLSQRYYAPGLDIPPDHVSELTKLCGTFSAKHGSIAYHSDLSPAFDACPVPVSITGFISGELLENASRACSGMQDGEITLTAELKNDEFVLTCTDNGPGLSKEMCARIMAGAISPPSEGGTGGYGLYFLTQIVRRIASQRGALILASNIKPHGSCVQVLFSQEEHDA